MSIRRMFEILFLCFTTTQCRLCIKLIVLSITQDQYVLVITLLEALLLVCKSKDEACKPQQHDKGCNNSFIGSYVILVVAKFLVLVYIRYKTFTLITSTKHCV